MVFIFSNPLTASNAAELFCFDALVRSEVSATRRKRTPLVNCDRWSSRSGSRNAGGRANPTAGRWNPKPPRPIGKRRPVSRLTMVGLKSVDTSGRGPQMLRASHGGQADNDLDCRVRRQVRARPRILTTSQRCVRTRPVGPAESREPNGRAHGLCRHHRCPGRLNFLNDRQQA